MKLFLSYDAALDAWTLTHENVHLGALRDVYNWELLARETLAPLPARGAYLLVDVTGFTLAPVMSPEYGALVKTLVMPRLRSLIRYGRTTQETQATIHLQGSVHRFPPGVLPDRASAIAMLEKIKQQP